MSLLFARVAKLAKATFDLKNASTFDVNLSSLKQLVDQLQASDIGIPTDCMSARAFTNPNKAPCTFIEIYLDDLISMSVFILAPAYTMPLHDHQKMHGLLKVLSGTANIQSFTASPSIDRQDDMRRITARAEPIKTITDTSSAVLLTPDYSNFHEITASDDRPAAFFDILAPPYGQRNCSFYRYRRLTGDDGDNQTLYSLERIRCPQQYYCDTIDYVPPTFLYDTN